MLIHEEKIMKFLMAILMASNFIQLGCAQAPSICDWRDKDTFGECLEEKFIGEDKSLIEDFLTSQGFATFRENETSSTRYYQKTTNSLSGYKVAVIIGFDPGMKLKYIKVR